MAIGLGAGLLIGAGSSLLSSGIGAGVSASMNKKTRQFAAQQQEDQQQFAIEQFERSLAAERELTADERAYNESMYNKYESPAAMLAQYKDAGLNPSLMYGGINAGGPEIADYGNIQAGSSSSTPSYPQFDIGAHFSDIAQNLLTFGQQSLNRQSVLNDTNRVDYERTVAQAQTLKYLSERDLIDKETYEKELDNIFKQSTLGKRIEQVNVSVEEGRQRIAESQQSIAESLSRMNVNEAKIAEINSNISLISQNISNLKLIADKTKAETFRTWEEGRNEVARRENIYADTYLKEASRCLTDARKNLVDLESQLKQLDIPKAEVDAFLAPIRSTTEIIGNIFSFKNLIK